MKGRLIAVSSLSAAFALLFSLIGGIWGRFLLTFGVLSSLSVSVPLLSDNVKGAVLSYAAASLLISVFLPYKALLFILFFGVYPSVFYLASKINKIYALCLKAVYFLIILLAFHLLSGIILDVALLNSIIEKKLLFLYYPLGTALLFLYDYVWKTVFLILKNKFSRYL